MRRTLFGVLGLFGLAGLGLGSSRAASNGSVTASLAVPTGPRPRRVYSMGLSSPNSVRVFGRNNAAAYRRKLAGRVHRRAIARKKSGGR